MAKKHEAKELRYDVTLMQPDGVTAIGSPIGASIEDLSGRRLEQAQLIAAETSHMILLRYPDALPLPPQGYIQVADPGTGLTALYIVDYTTDPRVPRPRAWTEVYCHVERAGN